MRKLYTIFLLSLFIINPLFVYTMDDGFKGSSRTNISTSKSIVPEQAGLTSQALPIVLLHGINSNPGSMVPLISRIRDAFKKAGVECPLIRNIALVKKNQKLTSFEGLKVQIVAITKQLLTMLEKDSCWGEINAIGHSQGGFLLRCVLQSMHPTIKVRNYISLAGPQAGVHGAPEGYLDKYKWENKIVHSKLFSKLITPLLNSKLSRTVCSFCDYWDVPDGYRKDGYTDVHDILTTFNNDTDHLFAKRNRAWVMSLNNWVLAKSVKDQIVVPRESEWFGHYDASCNKIIPMEKTRTYKAQGLNLESLVDAKKLHKISVRCSHHLLPDDQYTFEHCVKPFIGLPAPTKSTKS